MSDEQPKDATRKPNEALSGEVRNSVIVPRENGGALRSGGRHPRIDHPTDADCAETARRVLYSVIPRLKRIATNTPQHERTKTGRASKRTKLKRPYSVNSQLKAISELRMIAMMDRTLREARVTANLLATRDEIFEFLPRDQAETLMAKIAPHWWDT